MNISAKMRERAILRALLNGNQLINQSSIRQLMRISVILLIISFSTLQVLIASSVKGQDISVEKISIDLHQESLISAIRKIEQQTSLRFYYRKQDIINIKSVNLPFAVRTIEQTMQEILKNSDLSFRQVENSILIEKKFGQMVYEITGRVVGSNFRPVVHAAIAIRKENTNQAIQSVITDTAGRFSLKIQDTGNYLIDISAAGNDKKTVSLTLSTVQKVIELEDIFLTNDANNLKEVSVVGKKAYIEQKLDRTVINVESLISNAGANALEVLEKSPGVLVDGNGSISFKGKPGVTIYIDGKPTYLSGANLSGYLKSMPASLLDQIELMDNPPAKYDAAGNAGVINIKTKKLKASGFNGSLATSYSQAHYGHTNESLNLNYRIKKINLFSNAAYTLNQGYRQFGESREYFDNQGLLDKAFEVSSSIRSKNQAGNLKLGMDYEISPKTTWGLVFTGSVSPRSDRNFFSTQLLDNNRNLDGLILAENSSKGHFNNGGVNLNYNHQFDSLGRTITFDLDALTYNSVNRQTFFNQSFTPAGQQTNTETITDDLPTTIHIYSAKTDYLRPLKGKAKFEAGLKSSYIQTDNEANYFNVINGNSVVNDNFTNHFLYNENVNAGYANFSKSFSRFSFQTGLRLENTNGKGHQLGNGIRPDSSFSKSYTNLFPTTYIAYKLDSAGMNLLTASYGRRIRRPFYQDLNPFITIIDKYSQFAGNPFLKPQYSDSFKLSYSYKSIITASLYYTKITDLQYEVIKQEGDIFIDGIGNIGTAKYFGASLTLAFQPVKWWMTNTYMQVFNNAFKGQLYAGNYLNESRTMGEINMINIFTLPGGWAAELSGNYVSKRANAQFINNATGQLNAGIQKKLFNNKGSVKLSARDLLNTYRNNGITNNIPNATEAFRNKYNAQSFTLGFSYAFGNSSNKKNKRDAGSADIEKGRVKQ